VEPNNNTDFDLGATPWRNLPAALRSRAQWLLAGPNEKGELKVPLTVRLDGSVGPGSSTNRETWLDFEYAAECAAEHGYGLGYVLSDDDPFTCIDYDVKNAVNEPDPDKHTPAEHVAQMQAQAQDLASYTELSQSGQGVHVWVVAKFPGPGIKRSGVEVYCRERFIACTGRLVAGYPTSIEERQDHASQLVAVMRASQEAARAEYLEQQEGASDDNTLMQRAWTAGNADKFQALWRGEWQQYGYPSQSEADLSLLSMLCFYTRDNEQARRLFRQSQLGMREKAIKDDRYLNYTLRLIRGRMAQEAADAAKVRAAAEATQDRRLAQLPHQGVQAAPQAAQPAQVAPTPPPAAWAALLPPPGRVRQLAEAWLNRAVHPVPELAMLGALTLTAGIVGYRWQLNGLGLNLLGIGVAPTGMGKNLVVEGFGSFQRAVAEQSMAVNAHIITGRQASGQALSDQFGDGGRESAVWLKDEFADIFRKAARGDSNAAGLIETVKGLYSLSAFDAPAMGVDYAASRGGNRKATGGAALSVMGMATPTAMRSAVTPDMQADGTLNRYHVEQYIGPTPPENKERRKYRDAGYDEGLIKVYADIATHAGTVRGNAAQAKLTKAFIEVGMSPEAEQALAAFKLEMVAAADQYLDDDAIRDPYVRAPAKAIVMAALLAVPECHLQPCITLDQAQWAIHRCRTAAQRDAQLAADGGYGATDAARAEKVRRIFDDYVCGAPPPAGYDVSPGLHEARVMPMAYLLRRTKGLPAFENHRLGQNVAVKEAVRRLEAEGVLEFLEKGQLRADYVFGGEAVGLPGTAGRLKQKGTVAR
jgi:hypothetical protein